MPEVAVPMAAPLHTLRCDLAELRRSLLAEYGLAQIFQAILEGAGYRLTTRNNDIIVVCRARGCLIARIRDIACGEPFTDLRRSSRAAFRRSTDLAMRAHRHRSASSHP
jgi:hypothetical protein